MYATQYLELYFLYLYNKLVENRNFRKPKENLNFTNTIQILYIVLPVKQWSDTKNKAVSCTTKLCIVFIFATMFIIKPKCYLFGYLH